MAGRTFTVGIRIAAEDRTSAAIAKITGSTRGLAAGLRRAGVTLEKDFNRKLELNRVLLDQASQAMERGAITAEDYRRAQEKIGAENERIAAAMRGTSDSVESAQGAFSRFTDFLKNRFVVTLGDVAALAQKAYAQIFDSARLESQTQALRIQLAKQGQDFDTFLAKLDEVARGTISSADLIKASSEALLRGIPADKIAELLEIARASAIATGRDTASAFDQIAEGVARATPRILQNLGIIVDLGPAYAEMAAHLGKSVDQLSIAEKRQATLNAVLEVGAGHVRAYGEAQSDLAENMGKANAAQANFTVGTAKVTAALGTSVAIIVNASAAGYVLLALAITKAREAYNRWRRDLAEAQELKSFGQELENLHRRMKALADQLAESRDLQWDQIFGRASEAAQAAAENTAQVATSWEDATASLRGLDEASEGAADGIRGVGDASDGASEQSRALTEQYQQQVGQLRTLRSEANATAAAIERVGSVQSRVNRVSSPELTGGNASGFGRGPSRFIAGQTTYR